MTRSSGWLCIIGFETLPLVSNPCSLTSLTPSTLAVAFRKRVLSKPFTAKEPLLCSQIRRALTTLKTKDFARAIWMRGPALKSLRSMRETSCISCLINRCKISKSSQAVSSVSAKPAAMEVSPFDGCGGGIGVVIRVSSSESSGSRYTRRGRLFASPCCWSKLSVEAPM